MWPEVPPAQPYDKSIQELTGQRPYKGTLMYYHQFGIQDPYEAEEAPEPNPRQRASDLIYYLEQSHHDHRSARHKPSHTLLGQRLQTHIDKESFRAHAPRRGGRQPHPEHSRELVGKPRPGRATELFLQGRVRADHHVVDESNVCPSLPKSLYRPGPKFTLKQSPWNAASDSYFGDPRDAFEENTPPPRERLSRQAPLRAKLKAPRERALPSAVEMDYARPPRGGGGHYNPHQQQQPIRNSTSWKGGPQAPQHGSSFKRFHANVIPYETDFNRKATGWASNYVHEEPTDPIFHQHDLDSYQQSPSFGGGGGGGHQQHQQQQYGDYNARPKTWQSQGQEEEEEPYVPYDQKRALFQQQEQQDYYQQQQYEQQQHQQRQHQQQQHHQPRGRGQQRQQRPPARAPRPSRGSFAPRQNYAGPQQQTWSGVQYESDDL